MTPTETLTLCKTVRAVAPAQKFEPETPDAWHVVLGHLPLDECLKALAVVAREQAFIAPADLVKAVRQARQAAAREQRAAIEANPALVPDADPDDTEAYRQAIRAGRYIDKPGRVQAQDRLDALVSGVAKALPHVAGSST